jgi:hypothetical protein
MVPIGYFMMKNGESRAEHRRVLSAEFCDMILKHRTIFIDDEEIKIVYKLACDYKI